jgi:hypothetical protein
MGISGSKFNKLETKIKKKNTRDLYSGMSDFKTGYQPRTKIAKDEKGGPLADSHSILVRLRNHL